jgi:hypothetical protein
VFRPASIRQVVSHHPREIETGRGKESGIIDQTCESDAKWMHGTEV